MIEIKNIHITYHRDIIKESHLSLNSKGITVIKGESGSGKTSLIRNILFQEQQFDEYKYNDELVKDKKQIDYLFSVMSQNNSFIEDLTVKEHFHLLEKIYFHKDINDYIERLEISSTFDKYPGQLSGGERNRISFLFCLIKATPIIVLDEPTASLDSYFTEVLKDIIIHESSEHLFIISSHDPVLFDIADTIYEIKEQRLHLIKEKDINDMIDYQPVKQKMNIAGFFMKMKKHNLVGNIFMTLLLMMSIVLTSLTAGYSLSDKNSHYDEFETLFDNEIIVYKPIMKQREFYFSSNGQEPLITSKEVEMLKNIEGVKELVPHIELLFSGIHESIEQVDQGLLHEFYVTVYYDKKEKTYTEEDFQSQVALVNYDEIDEKEIEIRLGDEGIFISRELAEILKINKKKTYEIFFMLPVPQYNLVGDAEISFMDEKELYPTNRVQCQYVPVKMKVAGILKGNVLCQWSCNHNNVMFIPNDLMNKYISTYAKTDTKTYYFDKELLSYTESYDKNHQIMTVCYSYPWTPNAYKLKVNDPKNYSAVLKSVKEIGLSTITSRNNMTNLEEIAYHISQSFVVFSVSVTVVIIFIYFILKYINLYKENSFKRFFRELNYSKRKIDVLMIEKYVLNTFIIMFLSLISMYVYQQISIQNHFVLAPITSLSVLMIIGLSVIIELVFPLILGGICHDRT